MKAFIAAAWILSIVCLPGIQAVQAQDLVTPPPNILPPPPSPPPPPRIEVPKVPKLDEIPRSPRAAVPKRRSFSNRVRACIEEGAAMGLGPNERAAYSRACANSR